MRLPNKEELILLQLEAGREKFGLEIVDDSGGAIKRGTVYVTLSRLEDKGYVSSRQDAPDPDRPGIPRRLYHITGEGRRALAEVELERDRARGRLPGLA